MAAAQTKGHKEDGHTEMQEKVGKERKDTEKRKVGSKARKQENRTLGVSIATNLPVSATKPRRGPCHTMCHLRPAFVGKGIKCHYILLYYINWNDRTEYMIRYATPVKNILLLARLELLC